MFDLFSRASRAGVRRRPTPRLLRLERLEAKCLLSGLAEGDSFCIPLPQARPDTEQTAVSAPAGDSSVTIDVRRVGVERAESGTNNDSGTGKADDTPTVAPFRSDASPIGPYRCATTDASGRTTSTPSSVSEPRVGASDSSTAADGPQAEPESAAHAATVARPVIIPIRRRSRPTRSDSPGTPPGEASSPSTPTDPGNETGNSRPTDDRGLRTFGERPVDSGRGNSEENRRTESAADVSGRFGDWRRRLLIASAGPSATSASMSGSADEGSSAADRLQQVDAVPGSAEQGASDVGESVDYRIRRLRG